MDAEEYINSLNIPEDSTSVHLSIILLKEYIRRAFEAGKNESNS